MQAAIPLDAGGNHFNPAPKVAAQWGISMNAMLQLVVLFIATVLAVGTAGFLHWLMLRAALQLMQPARQREHVLRSGVNLVPGTVELLRAYGANR